LVGCLLKGKATLIQLKFSITKERSLEILRHRTKLLPHGKARRIAVAFVKLPELLRNSEN
jgi:hypothetical protein